MDLLERDLRALGQARAPRGFAARVLAAAGLADSYAEVQTPIGPYFLAWNDGGISAVMEASVGAERFEGWFGREIGRAAQIEQRIALAQRAVLAHISAGLAHEPHRRRVDRLLPAGVEESPSGLDQWVTLSRFRARPTRSSSHSGLNRSSAPSSCSSVDTASSRK